MKFFGNLPRIWCVALCTLILLQIELNAGDLPENQPGFPIGHEGKYLSGMTVADLDHDGVQEILVGANGETLAYVGDGTLLDGWPVKGVTDGPPALVGDIDGDGSPDVVFYTSYPGHGRYRMNAYSANGTMKKGFPMDLPNSGAHELALGDVDGDGALEIIAPELGQNENRLFVCDGKGTLPPDYVDESPPRYYIPEHDFTMYGAYDGLLFLQAGWPIDLRLHEMADGSKIDFQNMVLGPIAVGDFDFDRKSEIVISTLIWRNGERVPGVAAMLNGDGTFLPGWPQVPDVGGYMQRKVLVDVDKDYRCDIVADDSYASTLLVGMQDSGKNLFHNSDLCAGAYDIACGDVDGDGEIEFVLATTRRLQVFDVDYHSGWWEVELKCETPEELRYSGISLGDVNGDGAAEIFCWSHWDPKNKARHDVVHLFDGNLKEQPGFPIETSGQETTWDDHTAIADLDGDNDLEVIFKDGSTLHAVSVPNPSGKPVRVDWAMRGHDATQGFFYYYGAIPVAKFLRGDANVDDSVSFNDVIAFCTILAGNAKSEYLNCHARLDINNDGRWAQIADLIRLVRYLFLDGSAPQLPFPECGEVPTSETLSCRQFECE